MSTIPATPASPPDDNATARRILIVEDHADSAESMRTLLEIAGHQVAVAEDGVRALAQYEDFRPEIVLCDISLAGEMDGYAVASSLHANPRGRPHRLVAISGYSGDENIQRALRAGFDAHLLKPIDFDALLAEVAK